MFSQVGPLEIVLVLAIALIVLGPKRLPDAARSVGKGLREFKNSLSEADPRDIFQDDDDDDEPEKVRPKANRPAESRPAEPPAAEEPAAEEPAAEEPAAEEPAAEEPAAEEPAASGDTSENE
jgi:TatA/E family protein of Tat protein translocase